jgi:hypothetical protein
MLLPAATHHEAKTLTSDTSPLRSVFDSPSSRPLTGGRLKTGTGLPISADGILLGSRSRRTANASTSPKNKTSGNSRSSRERRCRVASACRPVGSAVLCALDSMIYSVA